MAGLVPAIHVLEWCRKSGMSSGRKSEPHPQCHHREGGDRVFQSVSDQIASAAAYWMPACAGMTTRVWSTASRLRNVNVHGWSKRRRSSNGYAQGRAW